MPCARLACVHPHPYRACVATPMACPVKVLNFVQLSGWRDHGERHRMPAMAAVLALMRSSVFGPTPSAAASRLGGARLEPSRIKPRSLRSGVVRGAAATDFFLRNDASRFDCASSASRHASSLPCFSGCFTRDSLSQNLPSGRSPVSQDAASAYEIALGVASASSLSDAVTHVT